MLVNDIYDNNSSQSKNRYKGVLVIGILDESAYSYLLHDLFK